MFRVLMCVFVIFAPAFVQADDTDIVNSSPKTVSLQLENVSITTVLGMIARQHNLNLVISDSIKGKVSLQLDRVEIYSALDAILSPNGYNFFEKDGIIVVKSQAVTAPGELVSRVVRLAYIDPITVRKALLPSKSDKGDIIVLDPADDNSNDKTYRPNRLLITDVPAVVDQLMAIISQLDVPERMISIEVKIIETIIDDESRLGVAWPTQAVLNVGTGQRTTQTTNTTGSTTSLINAAGNINLNGGQWTWGTLSVEQLSAVFEFLQKNGKSKLISDPHITVLENHQAEIKIETIIPIPTVSRFTEGAATADIQTFEDVEVGIVLRVTPRINTDGRITLDVFPKVEEIIGFTGSAEAQKPITSSRSIRTFITVNDGETIALGGLLKEGEIERVQKVPLLGSIPLIGKLFTHKSVEKNTTDLIILITPRILP